MEVGKYALAHNTKDALAKFSKQYPNYKFKRTSINSWKASFKNNENSPNLKKTGRPNLLFEELLIEQRMLRLIHVLHAQSFQGVGIGR